MNRLLPIQAESVSPFTAQDLVVLQQGKVDYAEAFVFDADCLVKEIGTGVECIVCGSLDISLNLLLNQKLMLVRLF
jgi:hypothetical protein